MPALLTSPKHMIQFGEMDCYTNLIKYKLSSEFISIIQSMYDNLNLSVKLTN